MNEVAMGKKEMLKDELNNCEELYTGKTCMYFIEIYQNFSDNGNVFKSTKDIIMVRNDLLLLMEYYAVDTEYKKSAASVLYDLACNDIEYMIEKKHENKKQLKEYVYLIVCNECVKIGVSNYPKIRTKHLGTKIPFSVNEVRMFNITNKYDIEKKLHEKYAPKRMNGEWFNLSNSELEEVTKYLLSLSVEKMEVVEW